MKTKLLKPIWLAAMLLLLSSVPLTASAYDFLVNNIAYNIVSSTNKTVEVAPKTSSSAGSDGSTNYSGNIVINESVYYSGTNYTVVGIGESAFKNSFISSLKLPETLQYIEKEAFKTCFDLEELSIPASVTKIGASCFWMCPDLHKVYSYATTPPSCTGTNVFSYMAYNNATLYVPHGCLSAYQNAYGWKDFPYFQEMPPSINGHEYVDLQLPSGKLWATMNYGATSPSSYGNYVEWSNNDVVSSSWGNDWCTPTINDIKELINNCQWTWTTQNGIKGYLVKGNNGNTIFLPAAGIKMGSVMKAGEWCYYWSSTVESSSMTYILLSTASSVWYGSQNTMASLPIRPVTKNGMGTVLATGITLNKSSLTLRVGATETLVATVAPNNVTNYSVTWSSSNTSVATVSSDGLVNAKAVGNAIITATTTDGTNLTASCSANVTEIPDTITVEIGDGAHQSEVTPIYNWGKPSYTGTETLYLKDELGLKPGDRITSLSYYCKSGSASGGNFNIRMKNSSISSFKVGENKDDVSMIELLYEDEINGNVTLGSYSGGDWIKLPLSKPFIYNGDNIIIDIRNTAPAARHGFCYFAVDLFYGVNNRRGFTWSQAKSENPHVDGFDSGIWVWTQEETQLTERPQIRIDYIPASTLAITTYTVNGVSFNMVDVEGGTFTMGATAEQGNDYGNDELPAHQVTLSGFSIGQTEVTQELWQAVMGSNPSVHNFGGSYPVENVSWEDCQTFIAKLNQMTGKKFRLPTEAEWEFAARGGNSSHGYKYPGSDNVDEVAWYSCGTIHVVGTKAANELGLYDMAGNVEEYCYDWYGPYSAEPQINPRGASTGSVHVDRGSSYYSSAVDCRVSRRDKGVSPTGYMSASDPDLGLRLVMTENAGDVNGDGRVNVSDVSALINMILGITPMDQATGDVNGDGRVNVSDVSALINIILGIH